ncbi:hypothetical protein TYRP_023617, partial [Tyrophagus putrescentiae]
MKTQFVLAIGFLAAVAHLSTASPLVQERACRTDMCAGFAGFQCCPGYVCKMPKQEGPIHVDDQAGKCEKAEIHTLPVCRTDMCGGIAGFQCCEGFECQMGPIRHPDQSGKCVKKAPVEETSFAAVCRTDMCGGIAGFQCCTGYHCEMKHEPHTSDQAGKCVKNEVHPVCRTDRCGGIAGFMCCAAHLNAANPLFDQQVCRTDQC